MRRCTFDLNPDPSFPGCVYSEMKMCLAPCFKGCTDEAYAAEVARVQAYFDSAGQSMLGELEAERESLSAALDFEAAAVQHAKAAKIKGILSACDDIYGRLDRSGRGDGPAFGGSQVGLHCSDFVTANWAGTAGLSR